MADQKVRAWHTDDSLPNYLELAREKYPILKDKDIGYVNTPSDNGNVLEYWSPTEEGAPEYPRPQELPLGKPGMQVFDFERMRPIDALGDWASHEGITTDPTLKRLYGEFQSQLDPQMMHDRYQHHKEHLGEDRPYDQWYESVGLPEVFRGYTFDQWGPEAKDNYRGDQLETLNKMRDYLGIPNYAEGGEVVDPLNADPRLAAWAKNVQEPAILKEIEATKQPLKERGSLVPLGIYEDNSVHAAWPSIVTEPIESWKRMVDRGAIDFNDPESLRQQSIDSFNVSLATGAGAGALAPLKPKGSVGMFGGPLSKTANWDDISLAKQMEREGFSRDDIWKATGQWKFGGHSIHEFSDEQLKQTVPPEIGSYLGTLKEHYSHPQAYEAYPELQEMMSVYKDMPLPGESQGSYNPRINRIMTSKRGNLGEGTAAHEIQHAIGQREEWSPGSSPEHFLKEFEPYKQEVETYLPMLRQALETHDNPLLNKLSPEELEGFYHVKGFDKEQSDNILKILNTTDKSTIENLYNQLVYNHPDYKYRTSSGEVLARLTEKRLRMTPEERVARPPWKDLDVPEEHIHFLPYEEYKADGGTVHDTDELPRLRPLN